MRFTPKQNGKPTGSVGLILRTDAFSFAQYGLCLVYNPATNCTTGLCIGLRSGEYKQFLLYLCRSLHYASHHMLVPMVFVDFMGHMTARWLTYNRLSLLAIANSKEVNIREAQDNRGLKPDLNMDLDTATRKLTFMNDEYAITESISKTQLRFMEVIEDMVSELPSPRGVGNEPELFKEEICFLRQTFRSAIQNIENDRVNIQGLAQTMYCLISQKESRQNLVLARASGRIADESRKVAIWTRRDSTDMRIITVITMLFLPGRFTATLLGSSFFNFRSTDGERIISPYSWVYWVVTLLLTACVLIGWFFVSRAQARKMEKQLGTGTSENERSETGSKNEIAGFWMSRGDSAIWDERVIRAEEIAPPGGGLRWTKMEGAYCGADAHGGGGHSADQQCECGGCGGCGGGEG